MPRFLTTPMAFLALLACHRESDQPVKVILGATFEDGAGSPSLKDAVIVIDGALIRAIGPRAMVPVPQESARFDGTGKTVAPSGKGEILAPGKPANLLVLSSGGAIERAMSRGRWVPVLATQPVHQ